MTKGKAAASRAGAAPRPPGSPRALYFLWQQYLLWPWPNHLLYYFFQMSEYWLPIR